MSDSEDFFLANTAFFKSGSWFGKQHPSTYPIDLTSLIFRLVVFFFICECLKNDYLVMIDYFAMMEV